MPYIAENRNIDGPSLKLPQGKGLGQYLDIETLFELFDALFLTIVRYLVSRGALSAHHTVLSIRRGYFANF